MKTIVIKESFTGYPNGKRRDFVEGEEVTLAVKDADLFVEKGHAREVNTTAPARTADRKGGNDEDK